MYLESTVVPGPAASQQVEGGWCWVMAGGTAIGLSRQEGLGVVCPPASLWTEMNVIRQEPDDGPVPACPSSVLPVQSLLGRAPLLSINKGVIVTV